MGIFITVIGIGTLIVCCVLLIRNELVYREQMRVLAIVSQKTQEDIKNNIYEPDFLWRYREFEKVTYDKMLYQFWKPIKSFYKNNPAII